MRAFLKPAVILAAGAFAVAVPATAKQPPHPTHPSHPSQAQGGGGNDNGTKSNTSSSSGSNQGNGHGQSNKSGKGKSHKCVAHNVAYIASGSLVSFSATKNADGTYTGTITVHVTRTNHHAAADNSGDVVYTLTNARVRFGRGTSATDTGPDRVKVIGKITELAKKCDQTGFTPTVTVRRVYVKQPRKS
jgi:hypothetical protein